MIAKDLFADLEQQLDTFSATLTINTPQTHGLFHAIALTPIRILPGEIITVLLQDSKPALNAVQIQQLSELIFAIVETFKAGLTESSLDFPYSASEFENDSDSAYQWGLGFYQGLLLRKDFWDYDDGRNKNVAKVAAGFKVLTELFSHNSLAAVKASRTPEATLFKQLPQIVQTIAEFSFTLKQKASTQKVERQQTVYQTVRAGRNDPCPCGSGKKYKKCCASA